jgi:hypothetical protein
VLFQVPLLIINLWWKQMLVRLLGEDVHIDKKPLSGGTIPAALEGSIKVLLPMVAMQQLPDPREDSLVILGWIVEVPKEVGIISNPEPAW